MENNNAPAPASNESVVENNAEAVEAQENSAAEGQEAGSEGSATKESVEKAVAAAKKKLKIKYNGKEEDVEYDPNDEEYLRKQFQLARLSDERAREKATYEKELKEFFQLFKDDPRAALTHPLVGLDLDAFTAQYIEEKLAEAEKSPELREKEKLEKRLRELEQEREKEKEDYRKREIARLEEQQRERYSTGITSALQSAGLPTSDYMFKKVASAMLEGVKNGYDAKPEDVIPFIKEEMHRELKEMFGAMPEDVVEALVGKDTIGKIRKKKVAGAKTLPPPPAAKTVDVGAKPTESKPVEKVPMKDFFKF